jgi:DNA-binding XRE family transcriptional regulator
MVDFYLQVRQELISTMQTALKSVRQLLGISAQELGEFIGVTRQTINNLETDKNRMSATQYVAVCAVIDNYLKDHPELLQAFSAILKPSYSWNSEVDVTHFHNASFLKKWFLCFPDSSNLIELIPDTCTKFETNDLLTLAKNYKIFCDASSLCNSKFTVLMRGLYPLLKEEQNKLIVPLRAVEAIQGMMLSSKSEDILAAQAAMGALSQLQAAGLMEVRGEKTDSNIVSTFISVFSRFKQINRLMLITQNTSLAKDVLSLNDNGIGGFTILAAWISDNGELRFWGSENAGQTDSLTMPKIVTNENSINTTYAGWDSID